MNRNKIIISIVAILVIGLALWLILRKPKVKEVQPPSGNPIVFPMKKGSTGKGVEQLQRYLNQKYSAGLRVDGDWGDKTETAVQTYLKRDNISEEVYNKWNLSSY